MDCRAHDLLVSELPTTVHPLGEVDETVQRIPSSWMHSLVAQRGFGIGSSKKTVDAEISQELESYLGRLAAEDEFSGALLIAKHGKPIFLRAYGMADKSSNAT